jgi:hypothetical protein
VLVLGVGERAGDLTYYVVMCRSAVGSWYLHMLRAVASFLHALLNGSPFSFADKVLESQFLSQKDSGVSLVTRTIIGIELVIHVVLMVEFYRVARGRPVLEVYMFLFSGVGAMWYALSVSLTNPAAFRKMRIGINCFLRIWLTLVYTQVCFLPTITAPLQAVNLLKLSV